jgi:uncharacterized protein (DUF305 family)
MDKMHYGRLLPMAALSFVSMYVLMYAMVDRFANVYMNLNKRRNLAIAAVSVVALSAFWVAIRQQAAINDRQFLRSMIPHHAGAILMCEEASIKDPEISSLCAGIVSSQQSEIEQMKTKLAALE